MAMRVFVEYEVPYEGLKKHEFASKDEAVQWLIANPSRYDFDLTNVEMYEAPTHIDVFEEVRKAQQSV